MDDLPPELEGFASLLDTQPGPVRETFAYCLCLMMVEEGKIKLVATIPGEHSPICIFETPASEKFSTHRLTMSQDKEDEVIALLREILNDEEML